MEKTIYLRMHPRLKVKQGRIIRLAHIAQFVCDPLLYSKLREMVVYKISEEDQQIVVLDVMNVIKQIREYYPDSDIQAIGSSQTIIEIPTKKGGFSIPFFILVWILLFIGSGLAILNFHEETGMQAVHQRLYKMVTGKENDKPLILQVPYSLGIGLGMVLFFNHIFKKKFNEEPSPLEIEMFNYQEDIDRYVTAKHNENVRSSRD